MNRKSLIIYILACVGIFILAVSVITYRNYSKDIERSRIRTTEVLSKFNLSGTYPSEDPYYECRTDMAGFTETGRSCYYNFRSSYQAIDSSELYAKLNDAGFGQTLNPDWYRHKDDPDEIIRLNKTFISNSEKINVDVIYQNKFAYSKCYIVCGPLVLIYR